MGAATAIEWRTVREVVKTVVRSTLPEACADVQRAATVEWTVQDGEVREPVTGGAAPARRTRNRVCSRREFNEADGVSAGDVAEGGEPSESARQALQTVWSRSGAADRLDVQSAPQ